jgi:hypothetical protein
MQLEMLLFCDNLILLIYPQRLLSHLEYGGKKGSNHRLTG